MPVKDPRVAEIVWLSIIAIIVPVGGNIMLASLDRHRTFAAVLFALVIVAAVLQLRRAMRTDAPSARIEITKAAAYLVPPILGFVAIGLHVHWAIGACIAALEVAVVFDLVTAVARLRTARQEGN